MPAGHSDRHMDEQNATKQFVVRVIARSQRVRPEVAGQMVNSATKQSTFLASRPGLLRYRSQ